MWLWLKDVHNGIQQRGVSRYRPGVLMNYGFDNKWSLRPPVGFSADCMGAPAHIITWQNIRVVNFFTVSLNLLRLTTCHSYIWVEFELEFELIVWDLEIEILTQDNYRILVSGITIIPITVSNNTFPTLLLFYLFIFWNQKITSCLKVNIKDVLRLTSGSKNDGNCLQQVLVYTFFFTLALEYT